MIEKANMSSTRQLFGLAVAPFLLISVTASNAQDYTAGDLLIARPWARASVASNGVVYFTITNGGPQADRLIAVSTPVAKSAELHTTIEMANGAVDMAPLADAEIAQGKPVEFRPGGNHVMLMGLSRPLKKGERFPMTLTFEHAGAVTVEVRIEAVGAMAPAAAAQPSEGQSPGQ
ncbi:MAG TPA: copper chaperone PCu(A)C [Alphaproteobacteria bacterium]|nr:copper chaperone PCu(A)C [Alphaproteobacteria bacterium]